VAAPSQDTSQYVRDRPHDKDHLSRGAAWSVKMSATRQRQGRDAATTRKISVLKGRFLGRVYVGWGGFGGNRSVETAGSMHLGAPAEGTVRVRRSWGSLG